MSGKIGTACTGGPCEATKALARQGAETPLARRGRGDGDAIGIHDLDLEVCLPDAGVDPFGEIAAVAEGTRVNPA